MHLSKKHIVAAIATLTLFAGVSMSAQTANVYHFGISDQRTTITFQSETDFETVLGSTRNLTGTATADFDNGKAEIAVTVSVSSLRTGIEMRDEHLRSPMWLDADRYPEISFVSTDSKKVGRDRWKVSGIFTLHGVSRELTTTVQVRRIPAEMAQKAGLEPGEWIRVTVPFKVKLSDFGVKIPEMAAAKVNDTWQLNIQAYASTMSPKMAMNPCNPCNPCSGKAAKKASNPTNPCG